MVGGGETERCMDQRIGKTDRGKNNGKIGTRMGGRIGTGEKRAEGSFSQEACVLTVRSSNVFYL